MANVTEPYSAGYRIFGKPADSGYPEPILPDPEQDRISGNVNIRRSGYPTQLNSSWKLNETISFFAFLSNIFAAVVFASSPGVFRLVRGLTMDIKTRDYVAAAMTRGEGPFFIMIWEILPNARGPLIVDSCLRVGYVTILLGTLGFFGLGMEPESPDWGSMINQTRSYIRLVPTIVLPATLALASFVLGLNLLADGLREESAKD